MKPLLICIAHHITEGRYKYLDSVIQNILHRYPKNVDIIIDVNRADFVLNHISTNIRIVSHTNLNHPFDLTWAHRNHFFNFINEYEWFCYIEDDILIPYENLLFYQWQFNKLWPNYIPGLVRIEEYNNQRYIVDITEKYAKNQYVYLHDQTYAKFNKLYYASWILPSAILRTYNQQEFLKIHPHTALSREWAASYASWTMNKQSLVNIRDHKINPLCYSYHLANNYSANPKSIYGKLQIDNIID